jgi:membrane protease YdiL (CAAX protease family)
MHLPDWLSGVEKWMTAKEDSVNRVVELIMVPDNFRAMLLNLFMIAVLPAIGEELLFRGVFQKIFYTLFKSGHLAIWITAFIFSALHLQFFGFLPRFILGLIFGYLYYWSGTLWLPVISHFVNNAVSVIAAYIQGLNTVSELPDMPFWKQITALALPALICFFILLHFRNKSLIEVTKNGNQSGLQANGS